MSYKDREQQRKFCREHLRKKKIQNPKWHQELKRRAKMKRDAILDIVNLIKRNIGCLLCEETDPVRLQFHHVIPSMKTASISTLISKRCKLIIILKEIDKCVCVCSGCHRTLQRNIAFIIGNLESERWIQDWGLHEALEWSKFHPQNRMTKKNFMEVVKGVVRNSQMQDIQKFKDVVVAEGKRRHPNN